MASIIFNAFYVPETYKGLCIVSCNTHQHSKKQFLCTLTHIPNFQKDSRTLIAPHLPHLPMQPQVGSHQLATVDWTRNSQTRHGYPDSFSWEFETRFQREPPVKAGHLNGGHINSGAPSEKASSTMCMEKQKYMIRRKRRE